MHTFKELDYKSVWLNLTIICQKLQPERLKLMNDSQEYVPSESYSQGSKRDNGPVEEYKESRPSINKFKKKSSKYLSERLSAQASREGKRDSMNSNFNNSLYASNESKLGENAYSCIPCVGQNDTSKPRGRGDNFLSKLLGGRKQPKVKTKRQFDANKSVDYRFKEDHELSNRSITRHKR